MTESQVDTLNNGEYNETQEASLYDNHNIG